MNCGVRAGNRYIAGPHSLLARVTQILPTRACLGNIFGGLKGALDNSQHLSLNALPPPRRPKPPLPPGSPVEPSSKSSFGARIRFSSRCSPWLRSTLEMEFAQREPIRMGPLRRCRFTGNEVPIFLVLVTIVQLNRKGHVYL